MYKYYLQTIIYNQNLNAGDLIFYNFGFEQSKNARFLILPGTLLKTMVEMGFAENSIGQGLAFLPKPVLFAIGFDQAGQYFINMIPYNL